MARKSSYVGPVLVAPGGHTSRPLPWPSSSPLGPYLRSLSGLSCSRWQSCATLGAPKKGTRCHEASHLAAWMEYWERPPGADFYNY